MADGAFFFPNAHRRATMSKFPRFLLIAIITTISAGCADRSASERLDQLEERVSDVDLIDLRLQHTEERLAAVEAAVGQIREELPVTGPKDKKASSRAAASPVAQPVQPTQPAQPNLPAPVLLPPTAPEQTASSSVPVQNDSNGQDGSAPYFPSISGFQPTDDPKSNYHLLPGGRWVHPPAAQTPQAPVQEEMAYAVPVPARDLENDRPPVPAAKVAGDKAAYEAALNLYENRQYAKAQEAFKGFLTKYPNSGLAPNAAYWLGECYYSVNDFDMAILTFKDVAGKYPSHPKAAASLLKAGYAYAKMNDMDNAQFYWQILVDDFPNSQPAALARKRMGN